MDTFKEFANTADYESQQDLVGLAVYWISACNGQGAVPISEVHDILTLYDFSISDQAVATRMQQLEREGLAYYRERTGTFSGFQLTLPGFERYDGLSGGCPGMTGDESRVQDETGRVQNHENASRESDNNSHDVFISHAGEDKDSVARPLAVELSDKGFDVWFDEFELQIGDRLRRKIDDGLQNSNYGIIILSEAFFGKKWPENELDGLLSLEEEGKENILPLWYGVGEREVTQYAPSLSGRVAGKIDEDNVGHIADSLTRVLEN